MPAGNALTIPKGGTGQVTAAGARKALGLEIGVDVQAHDNDLDAISALAGTGIAVRTAADTWTTRTLQAPAAGFTITNPAGIAGDPTFVLSNDLGAIEALNTNAILVRTAADTWAARTLTAPAAGITITNPAGTAGNPTFALANDLNALEGLSTNGLVTRTATDTMTTRTITGTANEITLVNGDGVAGNPVVSIPSSVTFTGKTITGGTYSGVTLSGTTTVSGLLDVTNGQIGFPATDNPSAGANVLDDYEEGSWTPTMTFNGSSTGVTYTTQSGRYTKIGRLVYLEGEVLLSSNGSGVGTAAITGLPFTPGSNGGSGVIMLSGGSTLTAGASAIVSSGSTSLIIRQNNTAGSATSTDTNVTDTGRFFISVTYSI